MFPRRPITTISPFSPPSPMNNNNQGGTIQEEIRAQLQSRGLTVNNNGPSTTMIFTSPGSYNVSIQHQVVPATAPHPLPPPRETRSRSTTFGAAMRSQSDSPWSSPRTPSPRYSPLAYGNLTQDGRATPQSSASPSSSSSPRSLMFQESQDVEMTDGSEAIQTPHNSQNGNFGNQSSPTTIPATPPQTTMYYAGY